MYDCQRCQRQGEKGSRTLEERSRLHCGWMDKLDWSSERDIPREIGARHDLSVPGVEYQEVRDDGTYFPDVCPGWLCSQPLVGEIAIAWEAYDKGSFEAFYPDPPNVIVEGVQEVARSIAADSARRMRVRNKQIEANSGR